MCDPRVAFKLWGLGERLVKAVLRAGKFGVGDAGTPQGFPDVAAERHQVQKKVRRGTTSFLTVESS